METTARTAILALLVAAALAGCTAPGDDGPASCLDAAMHRSILEAATGSVDVSEHPDRVVTIEIGGSFQGTEVSLAIARDLPNRTLRVQGSVGGAAIDARAVGEAWSIDDAVEGTVGYGRDLDPDGAAANLALRYRSGGRHTRGVGPGFVHDLEPADYGATCETRDGREVVVFEHVADGRRDVVVAERASPHRLLSDRIVDEGSDHDVERTYRYKASSAPVNRSLPRAAFTVRYEVVGSDDESSDRERRIVPWTQWASFNTTEVVTRDRDGVRDRAMLRAGTIELDGGTFTFVDGDGNAMLDPGDRYSWDLEPGVRGEIHDLWSGERVAERSVG